MKIKGIKKAAGMTKAASPYGLHAYLFYDPDAGKVIAFLRDHSFAGFLNSNYIFICKFTRPARMAEIISAVDHVLALAWYERPGL